MDDKSFVHLMQLLADIEERIFQQFRNAFFEVLERRKLDACQALLDSLKTADTSRLRREYNYHRAILLFEQRHFDQAEMLLRDLLNDMELSSPQRAKALLELANQLNEQGQWTDAEHSYRMSLVTYETAKDNLGRAKAYNNLGIAICFQVEQGASDLVRLHEAISYHEKALNLLQNEDNQWEIAKNWHGLGRAYGLMGQYASALTAFEKYTTICAEMEDHSDHAMGLSDMAALVHLPQKEWDKAEAALKHAISLFHLHDHDPLNLAETLTRYGNLLALQEHIEGALENYQEALYWAESIRNRLTAPTIQASYRATAEFVYTAPISLHLRLGNANEVFDFAERARSRVLADLLTDQVATPHVDIPDYLLEEYQAIRVKLDEAYAAGQTPEETSLLESELAELDRKIELQDPTYATLDKISSLTFQEVYTQLPPDAMLLTYITDAEDQLWIQVLTSAGVETPIKVDKVKQSWLQKHLLDHLDGHLQGVLIPEPKTGHLRSSHLIANLYKSLIQPVWHRLEKYNTIYIVPTGPLFHIPIGALTPDPMISPPLFESKRRIIYVPSVTILLKYCHAQTRSSSPGILAIAPQDKHLQFTQGAAKKITQLPNSTALLDTAASRQALMDHAEHYSILCFLGHAWFDLRYPMQSRIQLSDGALYASEILRDLHLNADLVILAACASGRGEVLRGDEILGLSRAMLYAGTPSLLVTLWPVHEIPTRLLIEKFVELMFPGDSQNSSYDPPLALTVAQRWLRTLPCAQARKSLNTWEGLTSVEIDAHLTNLWHMTHPSQTPTEESLLFQHTFFWSPYILIGDHRP